MKHTKILRILGIALILSLLMVSVISSPASAAAVILSPASGITGTSVTILGSGFTPSASFYVYFSNQAATPTQLIGTHVTVFQTVASATADASGVINTVFPIPSFMTSTGSIPVTAGINYIYVVVPATNSIVTVNAFTVIGNPAITLSPTTGLSGTSVVINGTGFTPSTVLAFKFDTTTVSPTAGVTASSATGAFSSTITVPATTAGAHTITATAGTSTASATFTVTASATLDTLSPITGLAGTDVVITGSNFPVSTALVFKFDTTTLTSKSGDSSTRTSGIFISTVTIPTSAAAGAHTITATAGTSTASATFTIIATPATLDELSPNSGRAGTDVTISGSHFPASTTLVIKFDNTAITPKSGDTATLANGSFNTVITVPSTATVTAHTITITAGSDTGSVTFTVTASPASLNLSSNGDAIGASLVIYGQGFLPSAAVTITYDGTTIATRNTDASGLFISEAIKVPAGAHGNHTITATDGINSKSATFTVESTPPQIPTPLAPAMGVSLKSPYLFDWADVTDASAPVTYELQISTAADFAAASIIFNKTGLKESQYKLTEAEATQLSSGNGAAYYWRERAIDGASNASAWTGAGQFSVPKPFSFVGWPLYLTIGVGTVAFFLLGLWLGRRTAFSY